MPELSRSQRLRKIAEEMRALPGILQRFPSYVQSYDVSYRAGEIFDEAIGLGAFDGPEDRGFRILIHIAKRDRGDDWPDRVWTEAFCHLVPDLLKQHGPVGACSASCSPIADLIDAEAARIETGSRGGAGRQNAKEAYTDDTGTLEVKPLHTPESGPRQQKERRPVKLGHWAVAMEHDTWWLFQWFGSKQKWCERGQIDLPEGNRFKWLSGLLRARPTVGLLGVSN